VGSTPGASVELPYPAGTTLVVVGVAHDDALNLREGPGTGFPVREELAPLGGGLVTTGRGWSGEDGPWWAEVTRNGTTGWVSLAFVGVRDGTEDWTARTTERLSGTPTAASMQELGATVARSFASSDPPSTVVMSAAPSGTDPAEVTYDVVGLGDDSVRAVRLAVSGRAGSGGFTLTSVRATQICARGTSAGELCP
jgi:hypothetical protein